MKCYEKILEKFSTSSLIAAGMVGITITVLDLVGVDFSQGPWQWVKGPLPIILATVSILSLAVGLERYTRFRQIDAQIEKLENLIERSSGGRFISNYKELYAEATRLVQSAREKLRTASMSRDVDAPNEYHLAIVELLRENGKRIRPILADMVIAGDPKEIRNSWRVKEFSNDSSVNLYVVDVPWSIDILVVDERHMIFAFPAVRGMGQLKLAFVFINQEQIVREFAIWYDEFLLKKRAIPYEKFLETYPDKLT